MHVGINDNCFGGRLGDKQAAAAAAASSGRMRARITISNAEVDRTRTAAEYLSRVGFQVRSIRPESLAIEGSKSLFETVFHCELENTDGVIRFVTNPQMPDESGGEEASLYFPRTPDFFP